MTRRSITARYDASAALDDRADELAGNLPASLVAQLTPTHIKAAEVLTTLLDMGGHFTDDETPAPMRVLVTMLRKSRPLLLEGIGKIPPADIITFMSGLRAQLDEIIDTAPADTITTPAVVAELPEGEVMSNDNDTAGDERDADLDRADLATQG